MKIKLLVDLGKDKAGKEITVSETQGRLLVAQKIAAVVAGGGEKVKDREAGVKSKISER